MHRLNILYVGPQSPGATSRHRTDALRRLGHNVTAVDPDEVMPANRLLRQLNFRTGYRFYTRAVMRLTQQKIADRRFDLAWINGGHAITREGVGWLKERARFVLNYCIDDPTGPRDPSKWTTFCRAIPAYDLCVVMREFNRQEYLERGAREVLRVMMGYDEVAHARLPFSEEDARRWASEVVFVGTWMPERGPFFAELIRRGVPLAIHGSNWSKAREWKVLQGAFRGPPVAGADYVRAIQYSKVAIGLLSKGNRDEHTTRSSEVPYIGSVLCAERTPEHLALFEDGKEAIFWSDAAECAAQCARLLADPDLRSRIAAAGHARVLLDKLGNEDVCRHILGAIPD